MNFKTYEQKLQKLKESAERKEKRLKKRLELAKGKPKILPMSKLKKDLKRVTHAIVRFVFEICYSCGEYVHPEKRTAGHFHTDGGNPGTRYDFDNLRTQHKHCNYICGGDAPYAARLLREIGEKRFLALDLKRKIRPKWSKEQFIEEIRKRTELLETLKTCLPENRQLFLTKYIIYGNSTNS